MKKRITNILLILALFGYLIFIGRSVYMLSWLAENYFCFVWAVIVLLWIFKQDICAKWLTFGSIFAVFPAQIVEGLMVGEHQNAVDHSHLLWGVGVWIGVAVLTLILGILFQYRAWRKTHPKPAESSDEANAVEK